MNKKDKLLYILSIVFLAISVVGGGIAVTGFFLKGPNSPILQLVGVIILLISYAVSAVLDFFSRKKVKKEKKQK